MSQLQAVKDRLRRGAQRPGRSLDNFGMFGRGTIILLEPVESLVSERTTGEQT